MAKKDSRNGRRPALGPNDRSVLEPSRELRADHPIRDSWKQPILLAIVIHFCIVLFGLAGNLGPSDLLARFQRVVAPYAVTFHQELSEVPFEMTHAGELDQRYELEVHAQGAAANRWKAIANEKLGFTSAGWKSLLRVCAKAAVEEDHDLLTSMFAQAVKSAAKDGEPIDAVRLVKRQSLPRALDQALANGELTGIPPEYAQKTMLEARVIQLDNGELSLIPVIDPIRTAKPKLDKSSSSSTREDSSVDLKESSPK